MGGEERGGRHGNLRVICENESYVSAYILFFLSGSRIYIQCVRLSVNRIFSPVRTVKVRCCVGLLHRMQSPYTMCNT